MLLDEDPAVLIHECIGNFNINPDRAALTRISTSLSTLSEARSLRLAEAASCLKKTARQLNTLSQQHAVTLSSHNPTEHASSILLLDAQKFKVAKESSALEIESERLDSELGCLQAQLKEFDSSPVSGSADHDEKDVTQDQAILKLKLYRSMGIDIEADTNGQHKRAVIRNMQKGTSRVINIDPQFSRSFYANHFWQNI